jgi:hypothetical protein
MVRSQARHRPAFAALAAAILLRRAVQVAKVTPIRFNCRWPDQGQCLRIGNDKRASIEGSSHSTGFQILEATRLLRSNRWFLAHGVSRSQSHCQLYSTAPVSGSKRKMNRPTYLVGEDRSVHVRHHANFHRSPSLARVFLQPIPVVRSGDGLELLVLQIAIKCGQFCRSQLVEVGDHVFQFMV